MNSELFTALDQFSTIIGLISAAISTAIWLKLKFQKEFDEQRIEIRLSIPNKEKWMVLPGRIERKHLTRAEVQGQLGTIPLPEKKTRYEIKFFNSAEFFERLEDAQDNKHQTLLVIDCTEEEVAQFDMQKITQNNDCKLHGF